MSKLSHDFDKTVALLKKSVEDFRLLGSTALWQGRLEAFGEAMKMSEALIREIGYLEDKRKEPGTEIQPYRPKTEKVVIVQKAVEKPRGIYAEPDEDDEEIF